MGAAYGPGLLPCILAEQGHDHPPDENQQIELLCQFAALNLLPLFHEVIGGVVYRFVSKNGEIQVAPIPDQINDRVLTDIKTYTGAIAPTLIDWLEAPLLIPGSPSRRNHTLSLPGHPLEGWQARNLSSQRNTLAWLHQEAKENSAISVGVAPAPRGYTATLGARYGYGAMIAAYGDLLDCLDYCDRFKFVCRISLPRPQELPTTLPTTL